MFEFRKVKLSLNSFNKQYRGNKEDDKVTNAGINEIFMAIGEQPQLKILNLNFARLPNKIFFSYI